MKDPLLSDLREIRRVRAKRSIELTKNVHRAFEESRQRLLTLGHDVVDCSSGEPRLIFKAPRAPLSTSNTK